RIRAIPIALGWTAAESRVVLVEPDVRCPVAIAEPGEEDGVLHVRPGDDRQVGRGVVDAGVLALLHTIAFEAQDVTLDVVSKLPPLLDIDLSSLGVQKR